MSIVQGVLRIPEPSIMEREFALNNPYFQIGSRRLPEKGKGCVIGLDNQYIYNPLVPTHLGSILEGDTYVDTYVKELRFLSRLFETVFGCLRMVFGCNIYRRIRHSTFTLISKLLITS